MKMPRLINSRCDAFKVWFGPLAKSMEDHVYASHYFIKHVPVPNRPALLDTLVRDGLKYFSTDFTAFESHFTRQVMEACEFQLYDWMLGRERGRYVAKVLGGTNKMHTRTGVDCSVEARRMSGEMTT